MRQLRCLRGRAAGPSTTLLGARTGGQRTRWIEVWTTPRLSSAKLPDLAGALRVYRLYKLSDELDLDLDPPRLCPTAIRTSRKRVYSEGLGHCATPYGIASPMEC